MQNQSYYDSARRPHQAIEEIRGLWQYHHLVYQLIRRDILTRYKRSVLGVTWTMLNPLGMMVVMTLVFSRLFDSVASYPAYVLSGLLAWNFFAKSTTTGMNRMLWGSSLMKRIYLPRTVFVIAATGTELANTILALVPLTVVMIFTGIRFSSALIFLPVALLLLAGFVLGFGLLISSLAVFFPDVVEMHEVILTAWMYLTPIIYPESLIPPGLLVLFQLNPLYWLVLIFRLPIYAGRFPTWPELLPAVAWSVGTLVLGWIVFTSKVDEYAYRI